MSDRWPCPCCGYLVLPSGPGDYKWCPICSWEDDPGQLRWPLSEDGPNGVSLVEAQAVFRRIGAMSEEVLGGVRPARPDEHVDAGWRPIDTSRDWFEANRAPDHDPVWPRELASLYWWRPTYWNGLTDQQPVTYDANVPADALIMRLREEVPEVRTIIDRVERRYGKSAPFAVCSELTHFVAGTYAAGDVNLARRIVVVLDTGLSSGDGFAFNCVAIAFLENENWQSHELQEFIDEWPEHIKAEVERQTAWRRAAPMREVTGWPETEPGSV